MAETSTDRLNAADLPSVREEHLVEGELISYAQANQPADERARAREHLDACPQCRQELASLHLDDGTGLTKLTDPMVGRMLGEYRVEAALARGGMGVVYRGVQPVIGKKVAIKVLIAERDENENATIDRLLEEARAVNAIRHPNIIDIFSFGSLPDGRHYFVMELLDGQSLDDALQARGTLTADEVMTVLDQSMSALGAAHQAGVIHRDLKPANLFVTTLPNGTWHVTVLDFGLAKRLGSGNKTSTNIVMGTPGFMAPEQIRGKQAVAQTDLYAMAVVAWVLLTGREPFQAEGLLDLMRAHLNEPVPDLMKYAPATPRALTALINSMLEKDPTRRPASAMAVQTALRTIRSGGGKPAVVRAPQPRKAGHLIPAGMPTSEVKQAFAPTEVRARPPLNAKAVAPRRSKLAMAIAGALIGASVLGSWIATRPSLPDNIDEPSAEDVKAEVKADPSPLVPEVPKSIEPPKAQEFGDVPEGKALEVTAPPVKATVAKARPRPVTAAQVKRGLDEGYALADRLSSDASRRLMRLELKALQDRLTEGDSPAEVAKDLTDTVARYSSRK